MSMDVGSKGVKSDINVTPLVDVVLVLLIIFMVITPMLQRGKPVTLPDAKLRQRAEERRRSHHPLGHPRREDLYVEKDEVKKDDDRAGARRRAMQASRACPSWSRATGTWTTRCIREVILEVTKTQVMGVSLAATQLKDEGDVKGSEVAMAMALGSKTPDHRHQRHAAHRRGAGAAHHLHGAHAAGREADVHAGAGVRAPTPRSVPPDAVPPDQTVLTALKNGRVLLNKQELTVDEAMAKLEAGLRGAPLEGALLQRRGRHALRVRGLKVLDEAHKAGVNTIGMMTDPPMVVGGTRGRAGRRRPGPPRPLRRSRPRLSAPRLARAGASASTSSGGSGLSTSTRPPSGRSNPSFQACRKWRSSPGSAAAAPP